MDRRPHRIVGASIGACLLLALAGGADARQGAAPMSANGAGMDYRSVEKYSIVERDRAVLIEEADFFRKEEGTPLKFADGIDVQISPDTHGTWETLANGDRLWRLVIDAPGATDLNLGFTHYELPPGATLHVDAPAHDYFEGPYTYEDNEAHGQLYLPVVPGNEAVIELYVPQFVKFDPILHLGQIGYGFRDLFRLEAELDRQGSCNIDVICPIADPWRDEIQSVAVYQFNTTWICTGTLVNNTAEDFKPYFLTAYHCGISSSTAPTMVVYWNFESPTCGALSGGDLSDNQTGAIFRSRRQDVDQALVELDDIPDPASNVYYAGWDNSGTAPAGCVGIHHPGTDEKAISFNYDTLTTQNSCIGGGGSNTHWRVNNWEELSTTEPGSSGSGIWDINSKLLVGFLSGGLAACGNTQYDCYGKFAVAWDGASASTRLRDWLDPLNTGQQTLQGSYPAAALIFQGSSSTDLCASGAGDGNGVWEPGETIEVLATYRAVGGDQTGISGTLTSSTPGVTVLTGSASWPNLTDGNSGTNTTPFVIKLDESIACFTDVNLNIQITSDDGGPYVGQAIAEVGQSVIPPGLPLAIPDGSPAGVTSSLNVADASAITDVNVRVEITHTYVGDLKIELQHPDGTIVTLLDRPGVPASTYGCNNDNLNVTFDDAASQVLESYCAGSDPWYVGAALPVGSLASLNGKTLNGTWNLIVSDNAGADTGVIADWELLTTPAIGGACEVCLSAVDAPVVSQLGGFGLLTPTPNPFDAQTEVRFAVTRDAPTLVEVFDISGRRVQTLLDRALTAGSHSVTWDGRDSTNQRAAAGIYFVRLLQGEQTDTKRVLLVK